MTVTPHAHDDRYTRKNLVFKDSEGDPSTIDPDDAASDGTSNFAARRDHQHAIAAAAPGNIEPDAAAAEGASGSFARADHTHGFACAAPSSTLGGTSSNSEGSASTSARSDHSHDVGTGSPGLTFTTSNAEGSSNNLVRTDASLAIFDANTPNSVHLTTALAGTAGFAARRDHVHVAADVPRVSATHTSDQAIGTGAWNALSLTTEHFDNSPMHSVASNTNRLTFIQAGVYLVTSYIVWDTSTAGGNRGVRWVKNGATVPMEFLLPASLFTVDLGMYHARLIEVAANDYLDLEVFQDSGGNLTLDGTTEAQRPLFQAVWVGT
jgi:hypothetical protein